VAFLVTALTKLEKINFHSAEEAQAENFRKMLVAMTRDLRVILVKLADRLHNMRTLTFLREEKQKRIARETLEIYAPLAHRLGINWIKTELEDLSFKFLYPEEYRALAERISKTRREREAYIERVIAALRSELAGHSVAAEVTGRPKHLWSIRQKMKSDGRDLDNLFDILAFRIIVEAVPECYEALGLAHALWKPVPGRFKDYIALPKDNNYQSLHTAVMGPETERIEIQIRTRDMHRTAELGIAAHWQYKEGKFSTRDADHRFAWLRQLLEWQRDLEDPTDFMHTVKTDLFANEVYVFTPQGEVRAFPRGATPIDFAYAIHTKLGHECTGAKANGSLVPLTYEMQNGDAVEILRTAGSKPKSSWTKIVKSGRAATKIRAFLRQEANGRSLQIGHELLEKELKRFGVSLNKLRKQGKLAQVAEKQKCRTENELLLALGYGKMRPDALLPALLPPGKLQAGPREEADVPENAFKRVMRRMIPGKRAKGGIIVDGLEGIATHFPRCCAVVHGEDIVGFVTRGRGITVHRKDCPRVLDYDPARRVEVRWDLGSKQVRPVEIRVYSVDTPGLLASMSQSFHDAGVNITAVNCKTSPDHRAVNNFTVLVNDLEQLNLVMHAIERIDGVSSVERIAV